MEEERLTPWEKFKELMSGPAEKPIELRAYNPFHLRPGDFVTIDDPLNDVRNARYEVTELDVYRRTIGDRNFEFVDYVLEDSSDEWLTIRVSDDGRTGNKQRSILLLFPDYEGEYDEQMHKETLPSGVLAVKDDHGEVIASYERVNGLKDPYRADVLVLSGNEAPLHESCEYWDFGRKREDGRDEFYIVEMSTKTGMFHTWRGMETSETELSFLRHAAG
jgi:hypothetical protein